MQSTTGAGDAIGVGGAGKGDDNSAAIGAGVGVGVTAAALAVVLGVFARRKRNVRVALGNAEEQGFNWLDLVFPSQTASNIEASSIKYIIDTEDSNDHIKTTIKQNANQKLPSADYKRTQYEKVEKLLDAILTEGRRQSQSQNLAQAFTALLPTGEPISEEVQKIFFALFVANAMSLCANIDTTNPDTLQAIWAEARLEAVVMTWVAETLTRELKAPSRQQAWAANEDAFTEAQESPTAMMRNPVYEGSTEAESTFQYRELLTRHVQEIGVRRMRSTARERDTEAGLPDYFLTQPDLTMAVVDANTVAQTAEEALKEAVRKEKERIYPSTQETHFPATHNPMQSTGDNQPYDFGQDSNDDLSHDLDRHFLSFIQAGLTETLSHFDDPRSAENQAIAAIFSDLQNNNFVRFSPPDGENENSFLYRAVQEVSDKTTLATKVMQSDEYKEHSYYLPANFTELLLALIDSAKKYSPSQGDELDDNWGAHDDATSHIPSSRAGTVTKESVYKSRDSVAAHPAESKYAVTLGEDGQTVDVASLQPAQDSAKLVSDLTYQAFRALINDLTNNRYKGFSLPIKNASLYKSLEDALEEISLDRLFADFFQDRQYIRLTKSLERDTRGIMITSNIREFLCEVLKIAASRKGEAEMAAGVYGKVCDDAASFRTKVIADESTATYSAVTKSIKSKTPQDAAPTGGKIAADMMDPSAGAAPTGAASMDGDTDPLQEHVQPQVVGNSAKLFTITLEDAQSKLKHGPIIYENDGTDFRIENLRGTEREMESFIAKEIIKARESNPKAFRIYNASNEGVTFNKEEFRDGVFTFEALSPSPTPIPSTSTGRLRQEKLEIGGGGRGTEGGRGKGGGGSDV